MGEVSLKRVRKEGTKLVAPMEMPKELYPSFNIYEDTPEALMKLNIGKEVTAKIKVTSKEVHEGSNRRQSIGFDVLSVIIDEEKAKG
jgi:hypothetical protein